MSSFRVRGPASIGRPRPRRSASFCAAASDLNRLAKPRDFQRSRDVPSWPVSYHRQMTTFFPFLRLTTLGNPVLVCLFLTFLPSFPKEADDERSLSSPASTRPVR